MTREEAIKILQGAIKKPNTKDGYLGQALDMAIKALEQEPVLDKVRTEIEEQVLESLSDGGDDWFAAEKVNECLEIIGKYKPESEEI